ncbi:MAG: glycosyltransferase [Chloroflexi bacterium]|nr:glycosyltransferase [Chloroflexota bacterium]MCY3937535.1 glycosyltransferase [Chloroflexota bacterium]
MTDSRREAVGGSGENRRVIAILAIHLLGENIGTGGDRVLVEFAKRWRRSGREVVVIAPATAPASLQSQTASPTRFVKSTPFDGRPGLFAIPFAYLFRAIRGIPIVAEVGADAIYSGGDFICNVLPGVWAKSRSPQRPRLAVSIHHINANPFARHGNSRIASMVSYVLQRLSFRLIKRHADIIFVLNGAVKSQLVDLGFEPERIVITGAGVDLERIDRAEAPAEPQFDACFAGRLNPTKGIFDLAPTWRKVVDQLPDAKLLVMGGGDEWRGALKSGIAGQGLEGHISVAGFVPDEDYHSSIKGCRVFIAPSYEEGFNIALCEGMACGLPAVAYSLSVYRELFGKGPTLVPTGDTDAMAREIVKLLTDRRYHGERAAAASESARRYDWQRVAATALTAIDSEMSRLP